MLWILAAAAAGMGVNGSSTARANAELVLAPVIAYSTRDDRRVHVLRADNLSLTASIDAGVGATELVIAPEGRWLVGRSIPSGRGENASSENRLFVLDLSTGTVHSAVDLRQSLNTGGLSRLPGMLESAPSIGTPPAVFQTDPESGELPLPRADPKLGQRCALSPDGTTAYISQPVPGRVAVVDLSTGATVAEIAVPMGAEGLAVSPDGARVWVASGRSGSFSIINTRTRTLERTVPCRGFPFRVRFSPDGTLVAVSCPLAGDVVLVDAADPDISRRVSVRSGRVGTRDTPTSLAFVPGGDRLAVLCDGTQAQVVVVDVRSGSVVGRVDAPGPVADGLTSALALVPALTARRPSADEPGHDRIPLDPPYPA